MREQAAEKALSHARTAGVGAYATRPINDIFPRRADFSLLGFFSNLLKPVKVPRQHGFEQIYQVFDKGNIEGG